MKKGIESRQDFLEGLKAGKGVETLLDRISEAFLSLDSRLCYTYVNKKFCELSGKSPADLIGRYIWDVYSDAVDMELYHAINRALSEQIYVHNVDYYEPLDLWLENHIYPSANGGLDVFIRNISDAKRAEGFIRDREDMYRNLFQNLLHGFAYCSVIFENNRAVDYTYISVNQAYEALTGLTNTIGRKASEVMPGLAESDPLYFELITRVALSGKPETFETFVEPLGKWFSITLYCPQHGYFVGLVNDITEKKSFSEQQSLLASIVNSSDDAIISKDLAGNITSCNPGAEKLFGYSAQEMIGFSIHKIIPEEFQNEEEKIAERIIKGQHVKHFETRRLRSDGELIDISLTVSPIFDTQGRVIGASRVSRDITGKKLSEEKVKKSENNLHIIFENSTEAFVLTDANFLIRALNTKARKSILLQYGPDEATLDCCFLDHIHPDRRENIKAVFEKVLQGETVQFEIDFYKQNDHTFWFQSTFTPVWENNKITGVCIAAKDITEKKMAENIIKQSEENFRAILENTVQGFILVCPDGYIKSFNQNAIKYGFAAYGRNMEIGESIYNFIEKGRVDFLKTAFSNVLKGEIIQYSRSYNRGPDKTVWIDFSISPVMSGGVVAGICIMGNDISDKKTVEQEREFDQKNLESLINNTRDLMWSVDREFRLITFNRPFKEYMQKTAGVIIKKGSTVLMNSFDGVTHQRYRHYYSRAFTGETFTEIQFTELPEPAWFEISFHPIYKDGEVIGTACFSRNISESKKNIHEKEMLIQQLSQNNKDLQQFAYITAHNLRGPIANLLGLTNLLDSYKVRNKELCQILDGVKKASQSFDETIRDLSSILTIKDNPSIVNEKLLFSAGLKKAQDQCARFIEESRAIICADFSGAPEVRFNKSYLESIFLNLLTNALKYRDYSRPLNISVKTEEDCDFVVLTFSDNGTGFDADAQREKVFKLYQRFHVDREGKGLGLFLIKSQLETLGGNILIDSKVNEGARFTVRFRK